MSYILPQALCALLWWMAAHPDEVSTLVGELEAAAVVAEIVVYREPLGGGEVLEYVWRDNKGAEISRRAAERRDAHKNKRHNILRVLKAGSIVASQETYEVTALPPHNAFGEYIALSLDSNIFLFDKKYIRNALNNIKKYQHRRARTSGSAASPEFHGWHKGRAHISHGCCGMLDHWLIDPETMKHSEPFALNMDPIQGDLMRSNGTSAQSDVTIYDKNIFHDIITGKWNQHINSFKKSKYNVDHFKYSALISIKNSSIKDNKIKAQIKTACYRESPCKDNPEFNCAEDEPAAVLQEWLTLPADRPHVLVYEAYLHKCIVKLGGHP